MSYLEERKPFARNSKELHSLSSGIIGEGSVNVDSARAVGDSILDCMVGKVGLTTQICQETTGQ